MLWPALTLLILGIVLAVVVGAVAYSVHVRDHLPSPRGAAGSHRAAGVGRHRLGFTQQASRSVTELRVRERAEGMRMYPGAGRDGRP